MHDTRDPARGDALRRRREATLRTQAALAAAADLAVGTVKRAEAGAPLRAETAAALCAVLGIPEGAFVAPSWGCAPVDGTRGAMAPDPTVAPSTDAPVARPWRSWPSLAAAAALEVAAWYPSDLRLPLFLLFQTLAKVAVCGFLVDWAFVSSMRRLREGARLAPVATLALAAGLYLWIPSSLLLVGGATAADMDAAVADYGRWEETIRARSIMDPSWDPSYARWALARWITRRQGAEDPDLDTPGTRAALAARDRACREAFLTAPRYDHETCDPRRAPEPGDVGTLAAVAWRLLVGGSLLPLLADPYGPAADPAVVMADAGFGPARELVASLGPHAPASHDLVDGAARSWADARRDRAGRGG